MESPRHRIYEFTRYYIDTKKGGLEELENCMQTIFLSDVKGYGTFKFSEHKNPGPLTLITTYQGDNYVAAIAYEDFRGIFIQYSSDIGELDNRTMNPGC